MKNKIIIGALAVAFAALLWSFDGTFLRPRLYTLPPLLVVFLEHVLGFIALLPFLFIYRAEIKLITKKQWLAIFWVALFGGVLGTVFMTKALFLTGFVDISAVILLQKFQPVFAIILAVIFLRERFPKSFYVYAPLAIIAGFFVTFKNPFSLSGIFSASALVAVFSLLAAFSWGSATTFGKYSIKNINYGLLAALRFGLAVLIMIIPAARYFKNLSAVNGTQWSTLVIIVFTSGAMAMWLYYFGLKKITASLATLCELMWPVSAVIFDYFLNHNVLSATQIIGAVVLIVSVTRIAYNSRSRRLSGQVMSGAGEGGKTGIHTANLDIALAKDLPRGLYTCRVTIGNENYSGLLYYGYNSLTKKDCLEVHIFNFSANILGQQITVQTERYLRLPKKFAGPADLAEQIKRDMKTTQ